MSRQQESGSEEELDFESAPEDDEGDKEVPSEDPTSENKMKCDGGDGETDVTRPDNREEEGNTDKLTDHSSEAVAEEVEKTRLESETEMGRRDDDRKSTQDASMAVHSESGDCRMDSSIRTNSEDKQGEICPDVCEVHGTRKGDEEERKAGETSGLEMDVVETPSQDETEVRQSENVGDALGPTGEQQGSELPSQTTTRFTRDIKDALKSVTDMKTEKQASGGWGWGSWFSSTASALGQGLQSAIHTVEETLGIPEPQEMARQSESEDTEEQETQVIEKEPEKVEKEEKEEMSELSNVEERESESGFSVWSGVSALSSVIASKSSELVSGGIDALEAIGRKTMDVISDGDPGLRQKRAAIKELTSGPAVVLSKILKDAKEQAEVSCESDAKPGVHFSTLFDEYQGFVHLEALELLCNECSNKLQSAQVSIEDDDIMKRLQDVKQAFELSEEEEKREFGNETVVQMASIVSSQLETMKIPYKPQKLEKVEADIVTQLADWKQEQAKQPSPQAVFECGIRGLAQLTSSSIELFRKVSELILLQSSDSSLEIPAAIERSHTLNEIAVTITTGISSVSAQFADRLGASCPPETGEGDGQPHDDVKSLIASLYLEASNCITYTQDAFQLLQPVLQLNSLDTH